MRIASSSLFVLTLLSGVANADAPSVPAAPPPRALSAEALSDAEFAFVRSEDKRRFWLSRQEVVRPVMVAPSQLLGDDAAFAPVAKQTLPAQLKQLDGKAVRLFTASGDSCEVTLRDWGLFAEFNPVPEGEGAEPDPAELARRAYSTDESAVLRYAVDITAASAKCEAALWARLGSLPNVPSYAVKELKGAAREPLRALLRKTTAYKEAQKRYREQHKGSWDRHRDTAFSAFVTELGEARHLVGNFNHFEDCESFAGDATGFFAQAESGYREHPNERSVSFEPLRAIDLNADGFPEWISEHQLVGWDGEHMSVLRDVEPESWFCPC